MGESWQNIGDLIAEPSALFTRLKSEPKWGVAFVLLFLGSVGLAFALAPVTEHFIDVNAAESGESISKEGRKILLIVASVIEILITVVGILLLSAFLTGASRVFKRNPAVKFIHIYASVVHLSLIDLLRHLVNTALLLIFKEITGIQQVVDMQIVPGLHHLTKFVENEKLLLFLSSLNLLSVWYIIVLTIGIRILAEVRRWQAFFSAVVVWLLGVRILTVFAG